MELFITAYKQNRAKTLKQLIDYVKEEDPDLLQERYFYNFWLMMHHYSPSSSQKENDGDTILKDVLHLLRNKRLIVKERSDILHENEQFSIQNMTLTLEEQADEI